MNVYCGPCRLVVPLVANVRDLRVVAGLRLVTLSCPGCGWEHTVTVSRPTYRLLWRDRLEWEEGADGLVFGLRDALGRPDAVEVLTR